ncbi:MAG TPA: MBL fold metallo-hydrolase [Actinomycetota bacterium]|jgi:UDP-MurNAc hydroxylase
MRITALGHAGLKVETPGATILIDPWFSPEGAFQGSWFPFPDNSHLLEDPELTTPTAVVISHEHLDHVDPWFLARVPRNVPVIVPRYPSGALRTKVLAGGDRTIVEAAPWTSVGVGEGTRVFFVSESSPMNHDSAIVVQGDEHVLLNQNDARLSSIQLREIRRRVGGRVDAFAFQGAGASWYPMCYGYSAEDERRLADRKRTAKLRFATSCLDLVEPGIALPFAGPPAFLDPEIYRHNGQQEGGIFPDQSAVARWLSERGYATEVLLPGDRWDVGAHGREADPAWSEFGFDDRWPYLEAYAARRAERIAAVRARYPEPTDSLWDPFRDTFDALLGMSPYFNERIGMQVGFDVAGPGGGRWRVDFAAKHVEPEPVDVPPLVEYRMESRWLAPILDGRVPWEDFFLSMRFSVRREPDLYNDHLLGLLKFAEPESLSAVEAYERDLDLDERITLDVDGAPLSVSRYCPHAGNDLLETGEILPGGILRCLAHHYEFDLRSGRCLNGTVAPLDVRPVDR